MNGECTAVLGGQPQAASPLLHGLIRLIRDDEGGDAAEVRVEDPDLIVNDSQLIDGGLQLPVVRLVDQRRR
jgi:hypothetical protein